MIKKFLFLISSLLTLFGSQDGAKVSGEFKLFYYNIAQEIPEHSAYTTALGGFLDYRSAFWEGLHANIRFYSSNPVFDDRLRASTLLYQVPSGDPINTLAVANLTFSHGDTTIIAGRQRLFTPMANDDTTRIIPYAYTGITASNHSCSNVALYAGYLTDIKPIISDTFDTLSPAGEMEKGFFYLGARLTLPAQTTFQGYGYYAYELYNALHLQLEKTISAGDWNVKGGVQSIQTFTNGSGKNLIPNINSGSDEVNLWAYLLSVSYRNLTLSHSLSKNEKMGGIVRAYGGYTKVYTSSMYETAKSQGAPLGVNLTAHYDVTQRLSAEAIYLKTTYQDPESNDYVSLYGGLKYNYLDQSYLYLRYEYVDRAFSGTDAAYLRVISTWAF